MTRKVRHTLAGMAVGIIVGGTMLTPAGAHVGGTVDHLWGHLKTKVTSLVYTKSQANGRFARKVTEPTHLVGASGEPQFLGYAANGGCVWKNYEPTNWQPAGFYKDPLGTVHLTGLIDADDGGTWACNFAFVNSLGADGQIFVLPSGYRPAKNVLFAVVANNQAGRITVRPDGSVMAEPGQEANAEAFINLDGISFRAAPVSVATAAAQKLAKPTGTIRR